MKATAIEIEGKVDELLVVLDKDIQHIQDSLSRLNELRSLVIRRDDAGLGKLLESIQSESDDYKIHELKRQSIRKELAIAFGCNLEQMTLSRLEAILAEEKKVQVAKRKKKLRSLTEELKKEHLSTALLLSECARFNSLLLKSIFGFGKAGMIIYSSDGSTKRQADTAFVNLRF
jgi:uncharacterized coiled-coil protein SlyX